MGIKLGTTRASLFIISSVICCTAILGLSSRGESMAKQKIVIEENESYSMVAATETTGEGMLVAYLDGKGDVTLEFDVLKAITSGHFGVISAEKDKLKLSAVDGWDADYLMVSAAGTCIRTVDMKKSDFTFDSGYRYRIDLDRTSGQISISRKENGSNDYQEVYYSILTRKSADIFGFALQSLGNNSAWSVIDNVEATLADGTKVSDSFEGDKQVLQILKENESSYAEVYQGPKYHVVFMDSKGNVVKTADVSQYSHVSCQMPDEKNLVHTGWSEDVSCVTKDLIVYPIYEKVADGS